MKSEPTPSSTISSQQALKRVDNDDMALCEAFLNADVVILDASLSCLSLLNMFDNLCRIHLKPVIFLQQHGLISSIRISCPEHIVLNTHVPLTDPVYTTVWAQEEENNARFAPSSPLSQKHEESFAGLSSLRLHPTYLFKLCLFEPLVSYCKEVKFNILDIPRNYISSLLAKLSNATLEHSRNVAETGFAQCECDILSHLCAKFSLSTLQFTSLDDVLRFRTEIPCIVYIVRALIHAEERSNGNTQLLWSCFESELVEMDWNELILPSSSPGICTHGEPQSTLSSKYHRSFPYIHSEIKSRSALSEVIVARHVKSLWKTPDNVLSVFKNLSRRRNMASNPFLGTDMQMKNTMDEAMGIFTPFEYPLKDSAEYVNLRNNCKYVPLYEPRDHALGKENLNLHFLQYAHTPIWLLCDALYRWTFDRGIQSSICHRVDTAMDEEQSITPRPPPFPRNFRLPEMSSSNEEYRYLYQIYSLQAEKDYMEFCSILQMVVQEHDEYLAQRREGRNQVDMTFGSFERFLSITRKVVFGFNHRDCDDDEVCSTLCPITYFIQHCQTMNLSIFASLNQECNTAENKLVCSLKENISFHQDELGRGPANAFWYLALRARLLANNLQGDILTAYRQLSRNVRPNYTFSATEINTVEWEECSTELERFGFSQPHTQSTITGALASENLLKILTDQFILPNHTLVINGLFGTISTIYS